MELEAIIKEIEKLPLSKRFIIMEQTLKSIKQEELNLYIVKDDNANENLHFISETSLAKEWLSEEDSRWDKVL